jgi:hypothetical protein
MKVAWFNTNILRKDGFANARAILHCFLQAPEKLKEQPKPSEEDQFFA